MKKVLVTGGAGFIGSHLVDSLVKKGYDVTVLDNFSSGYQENLQAVRENITLINGDINDYSLVSSLVEGTSAVFHLAAMVSVPESVEKPIECFETNVLASQYIITECLKNNSKFIFASSAAVYGQDKTEIKTENLETVPISPYGISKLNVEQLCSIYQNEKNLDFACFRNFNVYGPRQDLNSAYAAVIPSFIDLALSGKNLSVYGDGEQTRDFIYVQDVVDAYMLALEEDISGIYNLGNNEIKSIKSLGVDIISKINQNLTLTYLTVRKGDIKHSRASSKKYQETSSWKPKVSLDEGILKTINFYKNGQK